MMLRNSRKPALALALVLGLATTAAVLPTAAVQAADAAKPSVSKKFVKPLQAAQAAMGEKKYDVAVNELKSVEAATDRAPYDTFVMNQLMGISLVQLRQNAQAIPYFEGLVGSGFLEQAESDRWLRDIAKLYYAEKDYAKAAETGQKLIATGRADDETYIVVAQAQYLQKDYAAVASTLSPYVKQAEASGKTPPEPILQFLSEAYIRQNDATNAVTPLRLLIKYYPKPQHWTNLLMIVRVNAGSDLATYNVYRLMNAVGVLTEPNDVAEMVELAIKLGSPGEALPVLQNAMSKDIFKTDQAKKAAEARLQRVNSLATTDKAGLATFEKEALAAKTGEGDVRLGQALLSYGQPQKAVEAIQRGIGKGSLRSPDEAQILLGMSLLAAGRKDDAIAAFNGAKGADPKLAEIAGLWALHARG